MQFSVYFDDIFKKPRIEVYSSGSTVYYNNNNKIQRKVHHRVIFKLKILPRSFQRNIVITYQEKQMKIVRLILKIVSKSYHTT
ncbi:unnamed protein product [Amoebophrya sp. A25]|nr:unnamed protein product [Amoebophrya sp. A25]|eukprot:GSA25T00017940001.1